MTTEVRIPDIGENITEGTVITLLVKSGDDITLDQPLLELETDKAVVEIPSPVAGTISAVKVDEGDTVKIGQVIFFVEESRAPEQPSEARETTAGTRDRDTSLTTAPAAPKRPEAEPAPPPSPGKHQSGKQPEPEEASSENAEKTTDSPEPGDTTPAPASPAVRRLARKLGLNIQRIKGSGPGGRISDEDLFETVRSMITHSGGHDTALSAPPGTASRTEKLSKVREITAKTMTAAWTTSPMVTQFHSADITDLEAFRKSLNTRRAELEPKVSLTAFLIKFCAMALRQFPHFNSKLNSEDFELKIIDTINIGVAVDTERGLLVPVIRNAGKKGVLRINRELSDMAGRARNRKILPDELQHGTFTLSNLGGFGVGAFTPIVYPSQPAILGVGAGNIQAVFKDGTFVSRSIMPLALTYDHRVIDGADGARFIKWIADSIEQPHRLILEDVS